MSMAGTRGYRLRSIRAGWTDERIALLRQHVELGLSGGESGKILGVSRCACIGKANRLGINFQSIELPAGFVRKRRPDPPRPDPPPRLAAEPTGEQPPPIKFDQPIQAPARAPAPGEPLTVETIGPRQCRWPYGDPQAPSFHFCGKRQLDGSSYCPAHAERSFAKHLWGLFGAKDLTRELRREVRG